MGPASVAHSGLHDGGLYRCHHSASLDFGIDDRLVHNHDHSFLPVGIPQPGGYFHATVEDWDHDFAEMSLGRPVL